MFVFVVLRCTTQHFKIGTITAVNNVCALMSIGSYVHCTDLYIPTEPEN